MKPSIGILIGSFVHCLILQGLAGAQCGEQKLIGSDTEAFDHFGDRVSISGDRVLVGATLDDDACPLDPACNSGAAYVFRWNSSAWVQEAKLTASDSAFSDKFGFAVALTDSFAFVSSPEKITPDGRGAVYVFQRTGTTWNEIDRLTASGPNSPDLFGGVIDSDGARLIVGSVVTCDEFGCFSGGEVSIFIWNGSNWNWESDLDSSVVDRFNYFGESVAIEGNLAAIGAGYPSGSAHVFRYDGVNWNEDAALVGCDTTLFDQFGRVVALSGNAVLVGSRFDDDLGFDSGSAYVFRYNGSSWIEEAKLTASDGVAADLFADSVALDGDVAVVCASGDDGNTGAGYLFRWDGQQWTEESKYVPENSQSLDWVGRSVSLHNSRAVVSAFGDDDAGNFAGASYVWEVDAYHNATWTNYGLGWAGTLGIPSLTSSANPSFGDLITIDIDNSLGSTTPGALLLGLADASIITGLGGTLLVQSATAIPLNLPAAGVSIPTLVLDDCALSGLKVYLQALELDPGATRGVSFTPGLLLRLGS